MKTPTKLFLTIAGLALSLNPVMAQTTWTDGDPGNSNITDADNWSSGLPSSSNLGTIPLAAGSINFNASFSGYHIIQNAGDVAAVGFRQVSNGSWTVNGGTVSTTNNFQLGFVDDTTQLLTVNSGGTVSVTAGWMEVSSTAGTGRTATVDISGGTINANEVRAQNGGTINLNSGSFNVTGNNFNVNSGSSMQISGGDLTMEDTGRSFVVNTGGFFEMTSGSLTVVNTGRDFQIAGGQATISGGTLSSARSIIVGGDLILNGGNLTAATTLVSNAGFYLELGGSTAGSLTAASWGGTAANRDINWLPGSQMSMTITGSANWAETEWAAGRMFYNGQDFNVLGDWTSVTSSGGLGSGASFDWDGSSNTLALIPEPSTFALLGLAGLASLFFRRRRA